MTVTHTNGQFTTQTYRKPTHSGLGTHYTSFIPYKYKTNAIQTLLFRAYTTCSNWLNINTEFKFLTTYFQQNGFPTHIIRKYINIFLSNLHNPKPTTHTAHKEKIYISLPYLGSFSYHLKKFLHKLLSHAYPQLDLQFVFTNKKTIGSLFTYKDKIPRDLQSFVVYQYNCSCSAASYIGQTTCNLAKRIAQHRGLSERTGARLDSSPYSAIREHACKYHHEIDPEAFRILSTAKDRQTLNILESLHIKLKQPTLNRQLDTEMLITV